ncbi:DUF3054 domain-containing protein [Pedococcus sp.]|jgi:hypothetical protein|uniref:DUF3054 domain-containing protein n=1 Tax=Pedococcus sp. TaxID=2860345 RepID=UPI002E0E0184|nr:DUF3054 domain-containing protein [Pedococcus sp.]
MRGIVPTFVVDACLVLLFALIGRASHVEGVTVVGVLSTAWPFLVGLALGWVAVRLLWHAWPREVVQAVPVWLVTVAGGLVLRVASGGGGAPLPFVVVATVVLGAFIMGWRALAAPLRRRAWAPNPEGRKGNPPGRANGEPV